MTKLATIIAATLLLFSCNSSKQSKDINTSLPIDNDTEISSKTNNTQSRDAQLIALGVDFVAFGINPSWILSLDFDKRKANFEMHNGKSVEFKLINKGDNNIESAEFQSENDVLNIEVHEIKSYNVLTGEGFPYSFKIEFNGNQYNGFGKYLGDNENTSSVSPVFFGKWDLKTLGSTSLEGIKGASIIFSEGNKLGGSTGCNNYFGTYDISDNKLSMSNIGSTKMYCEINVEREFSLAQKRVTNYIITDNELFLYNKENKLEMRLTKSMEK